MCVFITIIFIVITFSFKNTLLKLFMSLECKYNKLQFGMSISCIEVNKQKLLISTCATSTTKLTEANHPRATPFLKERRDPESFPYRISVCAAFSSRGVSNNSVTAWKRCFLTELRTSLPLLIFLLPFFSCDRITRSKLWHVLVRNNVFSAVYGSLYIYIAWDVCCVCQTNAYSV